MITKRINLCSLKPWIIAIVIGFTGSAQAVPWDNLQLTGEARLKVLFWNVYDARLYTADGRYRERSYPIALQLDYLRDIESADLVDETLRQWQQQGLDENPKIGDWLRQLRELWPDVTEDDAITLVVDAGGASRFYFNDSLLGGIDDPEFADYFAAIWLSDNTTSPRVREQLIKGESNAS